MTTEFEKEITAYMSRDLESGRLKRADYPAAFLLARSDVMEAMEAGYDLKTIWEFLRETGRIPFRYETFLKYVRKYITERTEGGSTVCSLASK